MSDSDTVHEDDTTDTDAVHKGAPDDKLPPEGSYEPTSRQPARANPDSADPVVRKRANYGVSAAIPLGADMPHFGSTDEPGDEEILPVGTAYVTPDGAVGVVGYGHNAYRPLEHADFAAVTLFSGEVRKELAHR